MDEKIIDVWNIKTFDDILVEKLYAGSDVIHDYVVTGKKNLQEYVTAEKWRPLRSNSYAPSYQGFVEQVMLPAMEKRTIRAWHYTRLTDVEVQQLQRGGVYTSTLEAIQRRLDAQVSEGSISTDTAAALYAASPYHQQHDSRSNKFWMTSHPLSVDDDGVTLLLESWGGEGVYFWLNDADLVEMVKGIGKPRVIEIAVPLDATNHAYSAAEAVVATFARTLACEPDKGAFSLYSTRALGPAAVLKVHTDGEHDYAMLARGYPASFIRPTGD